MNTCGVTVSVMGFCVHEVTRKFVYVTKDSSIIILPLY